MGCSASDEGIDDDIMVEDDEDDLGHIRHKVYLTVDPMDPEMGESFKFTAWSTDTVMMLMTKLQEEITRDFGAEREHLLPVLWEPIIYYQGNPMVAHNLGQPLHALKFGYKANIRLEVRPLSGLPSTKNSTIQAPPQNKNKSIGGELWSAKAIQRPTYGIVRKTKPPKRDPREVLSESKYDVVVVEMGTDRLKKRLKKYMVVVAVQGQEVAPRNVNFVEVMKKIKTDKRPLDLLFRTHDGRQVSHKFLDPGPLNIRLVDRLKLLNDEYHDLSLEFLASPRSSPDRRKVKEEIDVLDGYITVAHGGDTNWGAGKKR